MTPIALSRLNDPLFASGRKTRSTDVIVFNTTPLEFTLEESDCVEGEFTEEFRPDSVLSPSTSIIYGSDGDSGVDCKVKYATEDGSYFQVGLTNPLSGKKEFVMELTPDLVVSVDMGTGANNVVKVIVKENPDYVPEEYEEEVVPVGSK